MFLLPSRILSNSLTPKLENDIKTSHRFISHSNLPDVFICHLYALSLKTCVCCFYLWIIDRWLEDNDTENWRKTGEREIGEIQIGQFNLISGGVLILKIGFSIYQEFAF